MDLHAEYSRRYGGPPRPAQSWHEVLAMSRRITRFDLRDRLIVADGTSLGQPVTEDSRALRALELRKLRRLAGEAP